MNNHKKKNIDLSQPKHCNIIKQSQFEELNKMPDIIHDLLKDNWMLKKEIYTLKKEKDSYNKNMNITTSEIKNYKELKAAIHEIYFISVRKNPFKKFQAYKKMLSLYSKFR